MTARIFGWAVTLWTLALVAVIGELACFGQGQGNIGGILIASNFASWSVPQGNSGNYNWTSPTFCTVTSGGITFNAFTVGVPVYLADTSNPSSSETVTPTAVVINNSGCSLRINPANQHSSFYFRTATAGLGEAMGYANTQHFLVNITPQWQQIGGITSMITSSIGNYNVTILDQRTSVIVPYLWNGSAYVANPFAGGGPSGPAGGVLSGSFPNPGLASSGTLPNGWNAITQGLSDASTLVATDAFVQAHATTPCLGLATWSSSTAYREGALACYQGVLYTATAASTNQTPSQSSAYWIGTFENGYAIIGGQFYCGGASTASAEAPCFASGSENAMDYLQQIGNNVYTWGADNNNSSNNYWSIELGNISGITHPRNFTINWAGGGFGADEWHQAKDNFLCWGSGDSNTSCGVGISEDSTSGTLDIGTTVGTSGGNLKVNNLTIAGSCTGSGCASAGVTSINTTAGAYTFSFSAGAGACSGTTCTFTGTTSGSGTVTNFIANTGSWPTWLVPSVATSITTPTLSVSASAIPFSALAALSANQVLGSLTATTPSGLTMPSCSSGTNALTWTLGTGFGCNSITGTGNTTSTSLTTGKLPKSNGATSIVDSGYDDGLTTANTGTYSGTAGLAAKKFTSTDTVDNAAISFGTGSGGDSTCPSPTSGTSYLCTKAAGISQSINGAAYSPIPISKPEFTLSSGSGTWGEFGAVVSLGSFTAVNAGHVVKLTITYGGGPTCTIGPTVAVYDNATAGFSAVGAITQQAVGTVTTATGSLAYSAGDVVSVAVTGAGPGNCSGYYNATATLEEP